jgi:ElaB/YqjD/DUF883 family membrane-anchored ribosome-binding protein
MMTNLSHRAKQLSSVAMDSIGSMKETLISRASRLGDQVSDIGVSAKDSIINKTGTMTDMVKNYDYNHIACEARTALRSDPSRTMMIAGGLGLALGFLLSRKH